MAQQPKTGFRFENGGVNLTSVPDSLTPNKYASLLNVRGYSPNSFRTRPGYAKVFATSNNNSGAAITDLQTYTAIETDNLPRTLARDANGNIWLDTGTQVGTMNAPQGFGASMLPWRPSQSPQTWCYVATEGDYQKFSAPDANGNVTQYKVGVAEGQAQLEAAPLAPAFTDFTGNNSNWTASGTATLQGYGNIFTDVAGVPLSDPVIATRVSIPVTINYYLIGSTVYFGNNNSLTTTEVVVQDAIPPVANCHITAIRYASNNNGRCQIVCGPLPIGEGPTSPTILGSLRRGAIVNLGNNSSNENVFVLSATPGPSGAVMFECSTNSTRSANDAIAGVNCIVVDGNVSANQTIIQPCVEFTMTGNPSGVVNTNNNAVTLVSGFPFNNTWNGLPIQINSVGYTIQTVANNNALTLTTSAGVQSGVPYTLTTGFGNVGTASQALSVNPFATQLGASGIFPTEDDYFRMGLLISNIADFLELQIVFVCNTYGTFTFTTTAIDNLSAGELAEIEFPISALVPSGTNISLADCTQIQVSITSSGFQSFDIFSLILCGGGLPDIGDDGAPYQYQLIGRSTVTGAQGNPNPTMRYGVSPRRQNVLVLLPAVAAELPANDPQVNIWDVYRYGGSVTSYQYEGSGVPATSFTDMYFDDTLTAGQPLPTQNFEPWPSVDVPWNVLSGGGVSIFVVGSEVVVTGAVFPATISRWLPGTLLLLGGQTGYTLRKRPAQLSPTSWLFDLVEVAGSLSPSTLSINEPFVARQFLPYVWGPDQFGYFYACGDPLRPGVVSFCTPNNPDVTASTNTNEPSTPSETLMGGEIIAGLSYLASSDAWWAMYPAFSGTSVFAPYRIQCQRGLAAPFGHYTDKARIFFWAKDGIGFHSGGPYTSLTDLDLYLLFPHEGTDAPKNIIRNGVTYYAPDYSRAATFRLTWVNDYLYADYQDSTGIPRTLVCFLKTGAWVQDQYADSICARRALVQPEGTLISAPELYDLIVMADNKGNVYTPSLTAGDNGAGISPLIATFEWDGQPERNSGLWEDFYIDGVPVSGLLVQPVMFGQPAASIPATNIGASASRILANVPVPDGSLNRFLGLQISWTDPAGASFTLLHSWRNFADPDSVFTWKTSKQTFGLHGYLFCGRLEPTYSSTAPVTLNLTAFDGTSAATMTIPSTGGLTQKILVTPTMNKGQLLSFSATSAEPFQLMPGDSLLWIRQWASTGPWMLYPLGAEGSVKP